MTLASPTAPSIYKRTMDGVFDERDIIATPTGFQSLFGRLGGGSRIFEAEDIEIDVDIVRGNERIAQMFPRGMYAHDIDPKKFAIQELFSTRSFRFPFAEEETYISAGELRKRTAGESPYERMEGRQRLRMKAFKAHREHIRKHIRLFEYLAAQVVLTGKQPAIIGATETEWLYDFKRLSTHTATASGAWLTAATDILSDLNTASEALRKNGKVRADGLILGSSAYAGVRANTKITADADVMRFEMVELGGLRTVPSKWAFMVESGFDYRGRLEIASGKVLDVFTYDEWYDDASGTKTAYMPTDRAIVFSSETRCDAYFGPNERLDYSPQEIAEMQYYLGIGPMAGPLPPNVKGPMGALDLRMFHFDAYLDSRRTGLTIRTQSAPIFAPALTDGFYVIDTTP
jgi:hypothetical protein